MPHKRAAFEAEVSPYTPALRHQQQNPQAANTQAPKSKTPAAGVWARVPASTQQASTQQAGKMPRDRLALKYHLLVQPLTANLLSTLQPTGKVMHLSKQPSPGLGPHPTVSAAIPLLPMQLTARQHPLCPKQPSLPMTRGWRWPSCCAIAQSLKPARILT